MIRYIEKDFEGWKRIEEHTSLDEEPCCCKGKEVNGIPTTWQIYCDSEVTDECVIITFSPNGD